MTDTTGATPPTHAGTGDSSSEHKQVNDNTVANLYDFVTVYKADRPCNKQYWVNDAEKLEKIVDKNGTPLGGVFNTGIAVKKYVPDLEALAVVIQEITNNPNMCMGLGFHPFEQIKPDERYLVCPQWKISESLKSGAIVAVKGAEGLYQFTADGAVGINVHEGFYITGRLKRFMANGSYLLLDKDEGDAVLEQWVKDMAVFVPDFDKLDRIVIDSNSSRVELKQGKWHCYTKIKDPLDLVDLSGRLLSAGNYAGFGVDKVSKDGKELARIITDCSVFSPERLIFDGKPTVIDARGKDITDTIVKPSIVEVTKYVNFLDDDGVPILDTSKIKEVKGFGNLAKRKVTTLDAQGKKTTRQKRVVASTHNYDKLKWDTPIVMKLGSDVVTKTPRQVFDESLLKTYGDKQNVQKYGEFGKIKCQSTLDNRNSTSWNGYLNLDKRGYPQIYDNGCPNRTWYHLEQTTAEMFKEVKGNVIKLRYK